MTWTKTNSKMATCSEVLSFLRILTSNSSNATPVEKKKEFDEVLQSNMERLRDALKEKGSLEHVQLCERLESKMNLHTHVNKNSANICNEVCKKDISRKDTFEEESSSGNEDFTKHKDAVRWAYVEACIELLKLLKDSLIQMKKESDCSEVELKLGKRGNVAPPLPADSLGVGDQKALLTAIQFVVILGICPNLFPGVGLPVEKRSGFARLLNIHGTTKSESRLFQCVDTLVECIAQPSLGSIVLSRHLGDILSGLLQICYAPVSAYLDSKKSNAASSTGVCGRCGCNTGVSSTTESHLGDNTCMVCKTTRNLKSETEMVVKGDSSVEINPSDVYKLTEAHSNKEDNHGLCITSSEREKCLANLQRILDRVYQPIVVRELLILQGSPVGSGKPFNKDNIVTSSVSGEKSKPEKHAVLSSQTPRWMRSICGQLLSERLMKPNGVKAVLLGVLEKSTGAVGSLDWQKCEVVAKVIANCPSQAESVEEYYKLLSPQVLELLHGRSSGGGRLFIRAASSIIREMLSQYPELAERYILSSMLEPLAKTTSMNKDETASIFMNELAVMRCIEDIHKVFVGGSQTSSLQLLLPIVHPLFELFCFTRTGVSHLRSALQEILVHVLKHADHYEALTVLYTLAFKHSPSQDLPTMRCSANTSIGDGEERGNVCVNLMRNNFVFAHGDDGGVVIKVQNDDTAEGDVADGILSNLRGDGLSTSEVRALCVVELLSDLKKDSVAGDFFIYLMQELTNVISDFSEDMNFEEIQQSLLILHLVAVMCEKLGPSMLKNTPQTLAFIQSTLKRACTILQADQEGLGTAFVTETLTMSLGMLSAVLGGAVEVKKEHRALIQDLLPLLETLGDSHPSEEVQGMANDLRIAIATHGAVWSQKMNDAARNLGKQTDGTEVASGSAGKKGKLKTDLKERATSPSQATADFDEAFSQLCDPFLPVRGHAMIKLASLLRQRNPKAMESADTLLKIFLEQLAHDDTYIYLAAIQGLVSLADIRADTVISHLTREFATCRKEAAGIATETKEYKEKGYYMPGDKVTHDSRYPSRSPELRMKLGEALVKATRNCGELVPRFSQHLLPALLTGVKDPEPLVRASSLSNLGDVCQLLRFSLGPIANEIFSCLSAVLKTDKSAEVRRAAVLVITLLLRGLGKNIMEVLSSTLKEIYQLLKFVESTDADDVTRVHAQAALGELDTITRDYLFPEPSFTKRIQVLP